MLKLTSSVCIDALTYYVEHGHPHQGRSRELGDKMFVGIVKDDLMVRVGPERYAEAIKRPHVRPMDFTGKPMVGYVYVAPAGVDDEDALGRWVELGAKFAATLPAKKPRAAKRTAGRGRSK